MKKDKLEKFIFVVKKTNELEIEEIKQINNLFNKSFTESLTKNRSEEEFRKKFKNNIYNYSFHGMVKENSKVIGSYNVIPQEFEYLKKKKIFGLSVDTCFEKNYRGNLYNLRTIANMVYLELINDSIPFVYGQPNNKFYLVKKKVLGWKDIGKLNYYLAPVNLKKILFNSKILNLLIIKIIKLFMNIGIKSTNTFFPNISKVSNEIFFKGRYNEIHKKIEFNNILGFFKIVQIKKYINFKILYLIDVIPLSKKNLTIISNELAKKFLDIELIVYLGYFNSTPKDFLKFPQFLLKNQNLFSGKILDNSVLDNEIFNLENWNVNSSNFDTV